MGKMGAASVGLLQVREIYDGCNYLVSLLSQNTSTEQWRLLGNSAMMGRLIEKQKNRLL